MPEIPFPEFDDDTHPSVRNQPADTSAAGSDHNGIEDDTVISGRSAAAALELMPDEDTVLGRRNRRPLASPGDDQTELSERRSGPQIRQGDVPDDSTRVASRSRGDLDDATALSTRSQSAHRAMPPAAKDDGNLLRSRAESVAAQRRETGAERRRVVTSTARIAYDPLRDGVTARTYSVRALPVSTSQPARPVAPPPMALRSTPRKRRTGNGLLIGVLALAAIGIIGAMVWLALGFTS